MILLNDITGKVIIERKTLVDDVATSLSAIRYGKRLDSLIDKTSCNCERLLFFA